MEKQIIKFELSKLIAIIVALILIGIMAGLLINSSFLQGSSLQADKKQDEITQMKKDRLETKSQDSNMILQKKEETTSEPTVGTLEPYSSDTTTDTSTETMEPLQMEQTSTTM